MFQFWLLTLTKFENWNKDHNILYLLDVLAKFSLSEKTGECSLYYFQHLRILYKVRKILMFDYNLNVTAIKILEFVIFRKHHLLFNQD